MNPTFIKPHYDSRGFAGIPARIQTAVDSGQYDAVVLFFVDAFGWRFFEKFQDAPFLKRMAKQGTVEKLTSQFPSTTAAHVTTMHTGLPVGESGVHEWHYYEPHADAIITPLMFSYAGTKYRDELVKTGLQPALIYPKGRLYPELRQKGVTPIYFGSHDHTPSTYSNVVMAGMESFGYKTLSEALTNMRLLLETTKTPLYMHLYFEKIDSLCHEYGPNSPQVDAEIETFLLVMEHYFERTFKGKKRVLFLMTADHGMAEVDPRSTIYLNREPAFAHVERFFKKNRKGHYLVPAGSPRDMFLYVKDELLDEAQEFLAKPLAGKADVVKTEWLIEQGYFGATISPRFRERVGNLVVLSYLGETVWWYEKDKFEMNYYGHHGGLTPQEMETVLYTVET